MEGFRGCSALRKVLASEEHLDRIKIDFNVVEVITVQDYNIKKLMWMEVHIYIVQAKIQAGNIWVKNKSYGS